MPEDYSIQISPNQKVSLNQEVLLQDLAGEAILLDLKTEEYFSLDDIGSEMLSLLTNSDSIQSAYEQLLEQYNVEPEQIQKDLLDLIEKLVKDGLVKVISQ